MKLKLIEFFDHFDDNGVGGYQGCTGRTQSQATAAKTAQPREFMERRALSRNWIVRNLSTGFTSSPLQLKIRGPNNFTELSHRNLASGIVGNRLSVEIRKARFGSIASGCG
jgi:hypothetical protein